jgi:transcriptional regulator with XRE-family HTH domain
MASAIGCSVVSYNRYENDHNFPRTEDLQLLYYMGCNLSWLITGEEDMNVCDKNGNNFFEILNKHADTLLNNSEAAKTTANAILNNSEAAKTTAKVLLENAHTINTTISKCSHLEIVGTGNNVYGNISNNSKAVGKNNKANNASNINLEHGTNK